MRAFSTTSLLLFPVLLIAGCSEDVVFDLDGGDYAQLGKAYVDRRQCARCHQPAEASAGILSGQLAPLSGTTVYSKNLSSDVATGIGGWADIAIVRAIRFGVDDQGQPLCPPMPHLMDMSDLEARAIVAYLRSLPAVSRTIPESRCPPIKPPFETVDLGGVPD